MIVTDHHRPGDDASRLSDRRHAAVGLPVSRALRHRRRAQARAGAARRRLRGALRHLDLVALATIADVVPLVDENRVARDRGPARARAHAKPGLRALLAAANVDPATVDAGAVGFRLAPRINAAGRLGHPRRRARADPHRGPGEAERLAERARGAEPRPAGRRGPDPPRGARRRSSRWPEARQRARGYVARRRGLARGRDRDRRLAARRAVPPPGRPDRRRRRELEGVGPLDRRVRPARRARARAPAISSGSAATAPPRASRSGPSRVEAFADAFAAQAALALSEEDLRPTIAVDAVVPRGVPLDARPLRRARPAGAVRAREPRRDAARRRLRARRAVDGRGGQAPPLPRPPRGPRRRQRDRLRPRLAARALRDRGPLRRRVPARGEPLERHRRAAADGAPDPRRARPASGSCATGSPGSGARGSPSGRPRRARSSRSSRSRTRRAGGTCSSRRRFRALLARRELARAA